MTDDIAPPFDLGMPRIPAAAIRDVAAFSLTLAQQLTGCSVHALVVREEELRTLAGNHMTGLLEREIARGLLCARGRADLAWPIPEGKEGLSPVTTTTASPSRSTASPSSTASRTAAQCCTGPRGARPGWDMPSRRRHRLGDNKVARTLWEVTG